MPTSRDHRRRSSWHAFATWTALIAVVLTLLPGAVLAPAQAVANLVASPSALMIAAGETASVAFTSDGFEGSATYDVTPPLPAGLTLETSADTLSAHIVGAPTTPAPPEAFTVTALVTSPDPADPTATVTTPASATVTIEVEGHLIAAAVSGTGSVAPPVAPTGSLSSPDLAMPLTFVVDPPLPPGVSLGTDGVIGGLPTAPSPRTDYVVAATDANGAQAHTTMSLQITGGTLATATTRIVGRLGVPVTGVTFGDPTWQGVTYSLDPTPPAGLVIDGSGALAWTPSAPVPVTAFTVTASDSTGDEIATTTLTIRVSTLDPAVQVLRAMVGQAVTPTRTLIPLGMGPDVTFSAALPPGLELHPTIGRVTGRPTESAPATEFVITASDASGATATSILTITVDTAQLLPPTILGVQGGSSPGSLRVGFTGSANAPTGQQYRAEVYDSSATLVRSIQPFSALTDITGLTPGASYTVIIVADPAAGYLGARSAARSGRAAPLGERLAAPTIISVTGGASSGTLVVSFAASSGASAGQVYTALALSEDQTTLITSQSGTASPITMLGLTPGRRYFVVVVADATAGFLESRSRGRYAVASGAAAHLTGLNAVGAGTAPNSAGAGGVRIAASWFVHPEASPTTLRVRVRGALARAFAQASTVRVPLNKAVVLRVKRPRGTRVMGADLRVGKSWVTLGPLLRQSANSLDLPALRATRAGTYALRLRCLNGITVYLKVMITRQ